MEVHSGNIQLVILIFTFGLALATFFGYLTHRAKLSPLLGYLIAGYIIGPYSPGIVLDLNMSEQLAEIGVILMLFGVGLHFKWQQLVAVKYIAIPGAVIQTAATTVAAWGLVYHLGWTVEGGIIFGLAIGVASTVVLIRVLSDNAILNTTQGHITVGWLLVEDLITVAALLIVPLLAGSTGEKTISTFEILKAIGLTLVKFSVLILFTFTLIKKMVIYLFKKISKAKSNELFTICVLSVIFVIAVGASYLFGVSIAVGAFLAGMVIGQTDAHHRAFQNTMPIRDAFMVIFFLSIGMLFNPLIVVHQFFLFICTLGLILILKPVIAFAASLLLRQPIKTAVIVGLGLAQIGEFSFILSEEAARLDILPEEGYDVLVACAIVSIALNPLLFKLLNLRSFNKMGF
jgi:CPA2 family monovalent cation:H+ antiporter-2